MLLLYLWIAVLVDDDLVSSSYLNFVTAVLDVVVVEQVFGLRQEFVCTLFVAVQFLEAVDDVLDHAFAVHHLGGLEGLAHELLLPLHLHDLKALNVLLLLVSGTYWGAQLGVAVREDALGSELAAALVEVLALRGLEVVVHRRLRLARVLVRRRGCLLWVRLDVRRVRRQRLVQ